MCRYAAGATIVVTVLLVLARVRRGRLLGQRIELTARLLELCVEV